MTPFKPEDVTINIAKPPVGKSFYFFSHENRFSTEIDGYYIEGTIDYDDAKVKLSASASKDGKKVASFSVVVAINHGVNGTYGSITDLKAESDGSIKPLGDFEDCVKRHAPDCVNGCCLLGGCEPKCIALCAVGAAACCLINPHC